MAQHQGTDLANEGIEALIWLADELAWETRLDSLRRPGRQPRRSATAPCPTPVAGMRRAG